MLILIVGSSKTAIAENNIECKIAYYPRLEAAKIDTSLQEKRSYRSLMEEAMEALKLNNLLLAEQLLSKAIKLKPKKWQAWQSLAVIYIEQKNFKSARICARTAYELDPGKAINKYTYGIFLKKESTPSMSYNEENKQMLISIDSDRDLLQEALKDPAIKEAVDRQDPHEGFKEVRNSILARVK